MDSATQEFFIVALPGLEDIISAELADWYPQLESQTEYGGITIHAPVAEALSMNLVLKTPTRILWRVSAFKCRDFPKLYNKLKKLDWDQYFNPECEIDVQVATRLSRLSIKSRIEETCLEAFKDYKKEKGIKKSKKRISVYLRFKEDLCTLSIDTSGERLHKRGSRRYIGIAPLRETIAASLLQMVERGHALSDPRAVEIVDPMMGSGIFPLEATYTDQVIEKREFAFENFVQSEVDAPSFKRERPRIASLIGYEIDKNAFEAAKTNLKSAGNTQLFNEDFFKAKPLPQTQNQRWLFCNPPYGERLKVKEPLAEFYGRLFAACEKVAHPDFACFLLPSKAVKGKFKLPLGWKVLEKRPFINGGIPVTAFVFGRTD